MVNLGRAYFFPPPMDRAEVLHRPSHAYVVWWKIIPVQNELVNPEHFQVFENSGPHCSRQATFQICPLCHSITLRIQRKSVFTNHFWGDSRQRSEFADFGALAPWKTQFFMKFHDFWKCHVCMVQTLDWLKLFPPPMDRAEVLHKPSRAYIVWWKIIPVQNDLANI